MAENRTFFKNVRNNDVKLGDIFSDVFRRHTSEENARLFLAGTPLTTPSEETMLSKWMRPYMFARIFAVGLILFIVCCLMGNALIYPFIFILGSFLVPVTVLFFFWEMNIPRNISFPTILLILFAGGVMSLVFTTILGGLNMSANNVIYYIGVGIVEETAKILAAAIWLRDKDKKYILNGMLVGAAVGAGFASMETAGYAIMLAGWSFENLGLRGALAIGGHVLWAAVSSGALVWAKGSEKLSLRHIQSKTFIQYFVLVIALHAMWDLSPGIYLNVGLCVVIVLVALYMLKAGLRQVVEIAISCNNGHVTQAVNREPFHAGFDRGVSDYNVKTAPYRADALDSSVRICGVSGVFGGQRVVLKDAVRIGRNPKENDLVFPAKTPGVSGRHCVISFQNRRVYIKDLGSTYGTFVNGRRINPEQVYELRLHDRVTIGSEGQAFSIESAK